MEWLVLFAATAVEVVDDDEEPVLGRDYKAEKFGSRTRHDHVRQYVEERDDVALQPLFCNPLFWLLTHCGLYL